MTPRSPLKHRRPTGVQRGPHRVRCHPNHCAISLMGTPSARFGGVGVTAATVRKWRGKFAAEERAGLEDAVRIGRPKADLA